MTVVVVPLFVAAATGALTIGLLVADGRTSSYENLVITTFVTFTATFFAALGVAKRMRTAALVSMVLTAVVVGGGFALIYAVYSNLCGSDC